MITLKLDKSDFVEICRLANIGGENKHYEMLYDTMEGDEMDWGDIYYLDDNVTFYNSWEHFVECEAPQIEQAEISDWDEREQDRWLLKHDIFFERYNGKLYIIIDNRNS